MNSQSDKQIKAKEILKSLLKAATNLHHKKRRKTIRLKRNKATPARHGL